MNTATAVPPVVREPELLGQTVVVIGGSAGIGLETARRARAEGADVILTGRNPARLQDAASDLGALSTATFDANDLDALEGFFEHLSGPIDHVMVTAGRPYYERLADMDFEEARRGIDEHLMLMLGVARYASGKVRRGGTLLFELHRTTGRNDLWVNEYTITYDDQRVMVVGIMEFRDDKVVRERIYFGEPWEAPAWRAQWVELFDPQTD